MAAAAVTGFNMTQGNSNMDVSITDLAVMAMADPESGSSYFCVNNVVYGGIGFVRQCSTCGWAWFVSSYSGTGTCTK